MNTKIVMSVSAIILGALGIFLTFAPNLVLNNLGVEPNQVLILLVQIIGGLYVGYAMLNWMTKESLIGGIYNRPIAIANFTHFLIVGLAINKALISNSSLPIVLWLTGIIYIVLGLLFALILFRHPTNLNENT